MMGRNGGEEHGAVQRICFFQGLASPMPAVTEASPVKSPKMSSAVEAVATWEFSELALILCALRALRALRALTLGPQQKQSTSGCSRSSRLPEARTLKLLTNAQKIRCCSVP